MDSGKNGIRLCVGLSYKLLANFLVLYIVLLMFRELMAGNPFLGVIFNLK